MGCEQTLNRMGLAPKGAQNRPLLEFGNDVVLKTCALLAKRLRNANETLSKRVEDAASL